LWENTNPISPPHEDYHVTEDMADKAITWMRCHLAVNPDKPFFMWWTPGAVHGPHHVAKEWADKYKGKFDDGWDAFQERTFERQKAMGWIPADTKLAPRPKEMPAWEAIPEDEKAFQARLIEVYAGFLEHTDVQVGKLIDELEARGIRDNTMVIYIVSDNGASSEGMSGSVAELNAQNGIPSTVAEHIAIAEQLGGLDVIGTPKVDNHVNAAWSWAGDSPFRYTRLIAAKESMARASDKHVKQLVKSVEKQYRSFDRSLASKSKRSILRSPTGEVQVSCYLDDLEESIRQLTKRFTGSYSTRTEATEALQRADFMNAYVRDNPQMKGANERDARVQTAWEKGSQGIRNIRQAFA